MTAVTSLVKVQPQSAFCELYYDGCYYYYVIIIINVVNMLSALQKTWASGGTTPLSLNFGSG
jgi:hypothetical protein